MSIQNTIKNYRGLFTALCLWPWDRAISILACLICAPMIWAAGQEISIREFPSLDKLPENSMHRIFQDSDGFMWYGTFNGLYRYDGYDIRRFRSDFNHPGVISDNYITCINEDRRKNIWFGTTSGCYLLDSGTYDVRQVPLDEFKDGNVFTISSTSDGDMWVSMQGALFRFGSDGSLRKRYATEVSGNPEYVYFVSESSEGETIVSLTKGGMYKIDGKSDMLVPYFHDPRYPHIERIIRDDRNGVYWLGTWGKGIVRFDPLSPDSAMIYVEQPLSVDNSGAVTGALYHIVQDSVYNYLWGTSYNDLFAFEVGADKSLRQIDLSGLLPPENKTLYEIYKDRDGKLWVTSFDVNSFIIDIHEPECRKYPLDGLRKRLNRNPAISVLCVDADGVFWFSQDRHGLCAYEPDTDTFINYGDSRDASGLELWNIADLSLPGAGKGVWAVTPDLKLCRFSLAGDEMKVDCCIDLTKRGVGYCEARCLEEDSERRLWIGTTDGVYVYNFAHGSINKMEGIAGDVVDLSFAQDGGMWASVKGKGSYYVDDAGKSLFFEIPKAVLCADVSPSGELWIGTAAGEVLMIDPGADQFLTDFSKACGMKGDVINSITVDSLGHVWIATGNSIKEFNPGNLAYRTFRTGDGDLTLTRFTKAVSYDGKGDVYFGGISGILSVSPGASTGGRPSGRKPRITEVKVDGESRPGSHSGGVPIVIEPDENTIEIKFSTLDFHHLDQVRYAYMMEGIDKDWIYLDSRENTALYHRLPKGEYNFKVKATDSNGIWSEEITEVAFRRKPAWYESGWAYGAYLLLAAIAMSAALSAYVKSQKRKEGEKWADSAEIVRMRGYIDSDGRESPSIDCTKIDDMLIGRATEVVEQNISLENFNVVSLADAMNMSRSTLSRKIKLITGKTPLEFIKEIKMRHAARLLQNKTATIGDVIAAVGYSDYKNFAQSFKGVMGVTPGEYQKTGRDG